MQGTSSRQELEKVGIVRIELAGVCLPSRPVVIQDKMEKNRRNSTLDNSPNGLCDAFGVNDRYLRYLLYLVLVSLSGKKKSSAGATVRNNG